MDVEKIKGTRFYNVLMGAEYVQDMTPYEALDAVLKYEGIIGYTDLLIDYVKIYLEAEQCSV